MSIRVETFQISIESRRIEVRHEGARVDAETSWWVDPIPKVQRNWNGAKPVDHGVYPSFIKKKT